MAVRNEARDLLWADFGLGPYFAVHMGGHCRRSRNQAGQVVIEIDESSAVPYEVFRLRCVIATIEKERNGLRDECEALKKACAELVRLLGKRALADKLAE